ncbi:MAG: Mitochondrial import inner membrane translocase subunit tim8 [Ramalina farinacea]|uniref:Mitochondrial import inner membrane translocase subunit n=1 Tax=Ramalina farinacea TaxID=258253 RepID=A0AA43QTP2_9LECA|nr:Mitochondrial import inner membrane translocase subunit tim8 [Ramalina farinacea]
MASLNGGQPSQIDESMLKSLSEADKRELQQTLGNEMQKARLQESDPFTQKPPAIHNLTDICWKKCVPGAIKSNTLDRTEATCAANCVDRFMDANEAVLGHLQRMQRGG